MRSLRVAAAVALLLFALTTHAVLFAQPYQASYIPYNWVEISGLGINSGITGDDQILGPFTMGDSFPFYGQLCSTLYICSNGWISFTSTGTVTDPDSIPDPAEPNNVVFALLYDLYPPGGGAIYFYNDAINNRFIVEWDNVPNYGGPPNPQKFEIILYGDGVIDLMYHTVQPPCVNASVVGIENQNGTQGLQCTYMGSGPFEPASETGIRISPVPSPVEITLTENPFAFPPIEFWITLHNLTDSIVVCDVWNMVLLPNGAWHGPTMGPANVLLPGGASVRRLRYDPVPNSAPAGLYWYEGRVGIYSSAVWDTSGFEFEKLRDEGSESGLDNWFCTCERLPNESAENSDLPVGFILRGAFPNPFNPTTVIRFDLPAPSHVNLAVYDTQGRLVDNLMDGWREAGSHEVLFDGSNLPSGIYFYYITAGGQTAFGKMLLLK